MILKLITKIIAFLVILIGLPFYLGYGNPLPFINQNNTSYDNLWLSVFLLMFIGLILGLKYENLGGYLVVISISGGIIGSLMMGQGFGLHMLIPLAVGILYLIVGYKKT